VSCQAREIWTESHLRRICVILSSIIIIRRSLAALKLEKIEFVVYKCTNGHGAVKFSKINATYKHSTNQPGKRQMCCIIKGAMLAQDRLASEEVGVPPVTRRRPLELGQVDAWRNTPRAPSALAFWVVRGKTTEGGEGLYTFWLPLILWTLVGTQLSRLTKSMPGSAFVLTR